MLLKGCLQYSGGFCLISALCPSCVYIYIYIYVACLVYSLLFCYGQSPVENNCRLARFASHLQTKFGQQCSHNDA